MTTYKMGKETVVALYNHPDRKKAFIQIIDGPRKGLKLNIDKRILKSELKTVNLSKPSDDCPNCKTSKPNYIKGIECPGCGFKEWFNSQQW